MYVPSGSPACSFTAYVVPPASAGLPSSTRLPLGSRTRSESESRETVSENVSDTWAGALSTTAPCRGSLPVSAACAEAGPAPASSAHAAARNSSTRALTRGAMVCVKVVPPSVTGWPAAGRCARSGPEWPQPGRSGPSRPVCPQPGRSGRSGPERPQRAGVPVRAGVPGAAQCPECPESGRYVAGFTGSSTVTGSEWAKRSSTETV